MTNTNADAEEHLRQPTDETAWAQISSSFFPAEIRDFVDRFPQSRFRDDAERRLGVLDEKLWRETPSDDAMAQRHYLALYPEGLHKAEAEAQLAKLDTAKVTVAVPLQAPPRQAPRPPPPPKKMQAEDEAVWGRIGASGSVAELRAFVDRYPHSHRRHDAETRIASLDDKLWNRTEGEDAEAQRHYLAAFPGGRHRVEAQVRLAHLEPPRRLPESNFRGGRASPPAPAPQPIEVPRTKLVRSREIERPPRPRPPPQVSQRTGVERDSVKPSAGKCFDFKGEHYCP